MPRECTNILVVKCTDRGVLEDVLARIRTRFDCYISDQVDEAHCELEFACGMPLPKETFEKITAPYAGTGLYLQLLSYELPDEYLEHHVFKDGTWTNKIREKYQPINKKEKSNGKPNK